MAKQQMMQLAVTLPVRIMVEMRQDGQVVVNGPLGQKALCLGILDLAKKAVMDFEPEQTSGITIPDAGLTNRLVNGAQQP